MVAASVPNGIDFFGSRKSPDKPTPAVIPVNAGKMMAKTKKKSEGLGDTIAKVTKATKIDKLVKFVAGEDCGCDERRKKLNKLFSYNPHIECLLEDEYKLLKNWFEKERANHTKLNMLHFARAWKSSKHFLLEAAS